MSGPVSSEKFCIIKYSMILSIVAITGCSAPAPEGSLNSVISMASAFILAFISPLSSSVFLAAKSASNSSLSLFKFAANSFLAASSMSLSLANSDVIAPFLPNSATRILSKSAKFPHFAILSLYSCKFLPLVIFRFDCSQNLIKSA